jgi:hypothetical protein
MSSHHSRRSSNISTRSSKNSTRSSNTKKAHASSRASFKKSMGLHYNTKGSHNHKMVEEFLERHPELKNDFDTKEKKYSNSKYSNRTKKAMMQNFLDDSLVEYYQQRQRNDTANNNYTNASSRMLTKMKRNSNSNRLNSNQMKLFHNAVLGKQIHNSRERSRGHRKRYNARRLNNLNNKATDFSLIRAQFERK